MELKRIDIKVGYACNNNCKFCIIGKDRRKHNRTFSEILKEIRDAKNKGFKKIVLTGGEVTIRPEFFKIIEYAKLKNFKVIHIETNGRMFSNTSFCKKTVDAGATHFTVSLHAFNLEDYKFLTNTSNETFNQVMVGLKNLRKYTKNIGINCTITKASYKKLDKLIEICNNIGINSINFPFVNPSGSAWINRDDIVPRLSEVSSYIHKAIKSAASFGIFCTTEMIPLCFMIGFEDNVVELHKNNMAISAVEYKDDDFISSRKKGKIKSKNCINCSKNDICEGFFDSYKSIYGDDEFIPIFKNNRKTI